MKHIIILIFLVGMSIWSAQSQSLSDYYQVAAENNPGLKASYKAFEASMQRVSGARSLPDPNFSFGYFISPVETRVGPQVAKFSLTQMFPWFGSLKAQQDAASLLADANYQKFIDQRNRLFFQVASSYYELYELQKLIALEKENFELLKAYKQSALTHYENGNSSMVDVLRADLLLKDSETNLTILELKQEPFEQQFNHLLNQPDSVEIVITDSLSPTVLESIESDSLLANNPEIQQLELKRQASEASEVAANKQGLPKIGIGLDYMLINERSDMATSDNGQDAFMPMVTVSLPVFRKKYKSAKEEARLMEESYSYQKQEVQNQLTTSYDLAQYELKKQEQLMVLYEHQIHETKQSLQLLYSAYSNSGKDFEEVLRMQQQLLKYKKLQLNALKSNLTAAAKINLITAKTFVESTK